MDTNNQPHVTPIFFVLTSCPTYVHFITSSNSKKLTNIRSESKVALTIDVRDTVNPQNNIGAMIKGTAEIIGPLTLARENLYVAFRKKYPVFDTWLDKSISKAEPGSMLWVRIKPSKMTWWSSWKFKTVRFP